MQCACVLPHFLAFLHQSESNLVTNFLIICIDHNYAMDAFPVKAPVSRLVKRCEMVSLSRGLQQHRFVTQDYQPAILQPVIHWPAGVALCRVWENCLSRHQPFVHICLSKQSRVLWVTEADQLPHPKTSCGPASSRRTINRSVDYFINYSNHHLIDKTSEETDKCPSQCPTAQSDVFKCLVSIQNSNSFNLQQ